MMVILILWSITIINSSLSKKQLLKEQLNSSVLLYKTNVSEKLSIIASSPIFVNYLRSGYKTRNELLARLTNEILTLHDSAVAGMKITYASSPYMQDIEQTGQHIIFRHGNISNYSINVPLCYLNDRLNFQYGLCNHIWTLYFSKDKLINALQQINSNIVSKDNYPKSNILEGDKFGSFPVLNSTKMDVGLVVQQMPNYVLYFVVLVTIVFLVILIITIRLFTNNIVNKAFASPISSLTEALKKSKQLITHGYIDELEYLANQIIAYYEAKDKIAIAKIAGQAAHDIRSPLAALETATKNLSNLPEKQRILIRDATRHIKDIANNLLQQNSAKEAVNFAKIKNVMLMPIVEYVLSEKRTELQGQNIEIITDWDDSVYSIFVKVVPLQLKIILSNLLNNAVEALITVEMKKIHVSVEIEGNIAKLLVTDNGEGVPENKIKDIFKEGVTFKKGGSGLGLSHARSNIQSWNGNINISSKLRIGTRVIVKLPKQPAESWFAENITLLNTSSIYIIDDSSAINTLWKERLEELGIPSIIVKYFKNPDKFLAWHEQNINRNINGNVYLIDYEYGNSNTNGLDIIGMLGDSYQSILVTSRAEDFDIQEQCKMQNIKLISKYYAPVIPFRILNSNVDIILLDDDGLLCRAWQSRANKLGKKLLYYNNYIDFLNDIRLLKRSTAIYISDSYLDKSSYIHSLGFSDITMITNNPMQANVDKKFKIRAKKDGFEG
jgi:signal transduction histidine kinase